MERSLQKSKTDYYASSYLYLFINLYSGLLAGKIVDACFEDILTQDPFKVVHEQRRAEAARNVYETSKLADSRSML